MPQLIIDHRGIEVPPGTKVIEAAERVGITIPRFCYHAALGSVGACRLCAVKFLDGPVKGLQMSCMVEALDGMVVSTTDAEAVDFRRSVIEWLMLHHPHDCPVCDEGGHCLLQDHTESSGHAIRRYRGLKRTHRDQYLGPLLQHEMNRCIQCYRCNRYYQEFAGYGDLGAMQIGNKVYFGRHRDGALQSPFAGNLADICPTGVFTDKPSRFRGRRWDYERTPSVCINCSLGCNTVTSARYREVIRQEARFSAAVNGYFICDRGRHGFAYASAAERPRAFRFDGRAAGPAPALENAAERLKAVGAHHGLDAVACIGSLRSSLETQGALMYLCRTRRWPAPVFFDHDDHLAAAQAAVAGRQAGPHVSLRAVESADAVLLVGCDPINEAPMLAMALRQAQRRGATVIAVDARPIELPLTFRHIPMAVERTPAWLTELTGRVAAHDAAAQKSAEESDPMAQTMDTLVSSRRPLIICGTDAIDAAAVARAATLSRALNTSERKAGLFSVLPGPNAFSAALFSKPGRSIAQVVAEIEQGRVKALLVVECDPFWRYSNRQRLADALKRLELLVVMDYLDGTHSREADVFLPSSTIFESGGTFVNQEGRAQRALPAFAGGTPIRFTGGGDHPPRMFGVGLPGADPMPAWHMLSILTEDFGFASSADILSWLAREFPGFGAFEDAETLPAEGLLWAADQALPPPAHPQGTDGSEGSETPREDELDLLTGDQTFGSEELSCRSPQLLELEPPPTVCLSVADAKRLALGGGDRIAIDTGAGEIQTDLSVSDRIVPGVLFLPRHHRIDWQRLRHHRVRVPFDRIRKVT